MRCRLFVALVVLAAAVAAVAPARADEPVFGVADDAAMQAFPQEAKAAYGAGFRFARVYIGWDEVAPLRPARPRDPRDPAYRWATADRNLAPYGGSGLELMVQLWHVPAWANGGGGVTAYASDPRDFADFAYALSRRYPYVRWWLPVNEPNGSAFALPATVDAYEPQLRAFWDGIKAADPTDRVVAGSTNRNLGHPEKDAWLWARTLAAHHAPMDAYAVHPYPERSKPLGERHPSRLDLWDLAALQRIVGVPVMVMEFGWSTASITEQQQAAWLAEAVRVARCTRGLARFTLWGFRDHPTPAGVTPDYWTRFGLLHPDGSQKPAYATTTAAMRDPVDCAAIARAPGAPAGWPDRSTPTDVPPLTTTEDALQLVAGTLQLRGVIDPNGQATRAWFEYRVNGLDTTTSSMPVPAGLEPVHVTTDIPIDAGSETIVEYRAVAATAWKTATGAWHAVTVPSTLPPPPAAAPSQPLDAPPLPTASLAVSEPPPALDDAQRLGTTIRLIRLPGGVQLVMRLRTPARIHGTLEQRRNGTWRRLQTLAPRTLRPGVRRLTFRRLPRSGQFRVRLILTLPTGPPIVAVRRFGR